MVLNGLSIVIVVKFYHDISNARNVYLLIYILQYVLPCSPKDNAILVLLQTVQYVAILLYRPLVHEKSAIRLLSVMKYRALESCKL